MRPAAFGCRRSSPRTCAGQEYGPPTRRGLKGEAMLPEYDRSGMTGAKKQLLKENPKVGPRHEARARRDAGCRKRWPSDLPIAEQIIDPEERGIAAPGLLAQIIVPKCCDHLPLYRQEAILENRHRSLTCLPLPRVLGFSGRLLLSS